MGERSVVRGDAGRGEYGEAGTPSELDRLGSGGGEPRGDMVNDSVGEGGQDRRDDCEGSGVR